MSAVCSRALRALSLGAAMIVPPVCAMAENLPAAAEQRPVSAYGEDHPACREWTDGCRICAKRADGAAACSTVGVACVPADVACTRTGP